VRVFQEKTQHVVQSISCVAKLVHDGVASEPKSTDGAGSLGVNGWVTHLLPPRKVRMTAAEHRAAFLDKWKPSASELLTVTPTRIRKANPDGLEAGKALSCPAPLCSASGYPERMGLER
jgi:hypothetical protein